MNSWAQPKLCMLGYVKTKILNMSTWYKQDPVSYNIYSKYPEYNKSYSIYKEVGKYQFIGQ